jgi:hypothetical protein
MQDCPDKGKLPGHILELLFVADPNHHRKCWTGELYKLRLMNVAARHGMTKMDCSRLQKNFGYMAWTLKSKPESKYINAAKSVVEHHFNNHQYLLWSMVSKKVSK